MSVLELVDQCVQYLVYVLRAACVVGHCVLQYACIVVDPAGMETVRRSCADTASC